MTGKGIDFKEQHRARPCLNNHRLNRLAEVPCTVQLYFHITGRPTLTGFQNHTNTGNCVCEPRGHGSRTTHHILGQMPSHGGFSGCAVQRQNASGPER